MAISRNVWSKWILIYVLSFSWNLKFLEAGELRDLLHRCPDGSFGFKCRFRCRCLDDELCDKITGTCYTGCRAGYWGPGCQLSDNCFYNGQARHYQGRVAVTSNLYVCQYWDEQTPHRHSYNENDFPDDKIPDNFCRTTKDSSRPWCYTTDRKQRWEHCSVNNCNCPIGRFGHNCNKECHCKDPAEECDSIMGMCQSGCALGWDGFDCQSPVICPSNTYGWDCNQRCYCKNPDHCERFTGPTSSCECQDGYFNAPFCEPVTRPRIIYFGNTKVNPGQPSTFNCTVASFPTPVENELRLVAPIGKRVTLLQSIVFENNIYTRSSLFQVNSVSTDEKYSCIVQSVAGEASFTNVANVFERPMLLHPPIIIREAVTSTEIPLEWPPWSRSRGDTGDPPIMWYSVWLRTMKEPNFRMIGVTLELSCSESSSCNYTVTDLTPNTNYVIYISVRRQGDTVDGPPGPSVYVKTACAEPTDSPIITSVKGELQVNSTYPKTKLIVKWQDPPRNAWNCNSIKRYQIMVASGEPEVLITHVAGNAEKEFAVSELEPATRYCVQMKFENNKDFYSPVSPEKCIVSPSTIPSAPTNLELLRRTSTSLTVRWNRPQDAQGNLTIYTIIYWKNVRELSTKQGVEWKSAEPQVVYTLEGLEPHTSYHIQVQAVSSAGAGDYSNILTRETAEDRPGTVTRFQNISRTQTSILLRWEPPDRPNGELKHYMLHCRPIKPVRSNIRISREPYRLAPGTTFFNYTGLEPSTQYRCDINGSTSKGSGQNASLLVWTEATDPEEPPAPTILGRSDSTVTLELKPVPNGSVSFYRIIVEELLGMGKRSLPETVIAADFDYYKAKTEGLRVYVAAQIYHDRASGPFEVGDNKTYSGYYNAPLSPNKKYNIWFGAYSEVDGSLRKSIAKAEHRSVARSAITTAPTTNHVPVIIGVIVVFIVLVLVVAMLLFIWRKRQLQEEREKAEMPNFGPTIIPEPDPTPPSTPIDSFEREPLLEATSASSIESEPVYGNIGYTVEPVKVEDLWDYVKNNKCNDCEGFRREYRLIPAGITALCEAAKRCENKSKNRYGNIVAYDHSRVVLKDAEADENDDYINASYIDGYHRPKAYIAAQGPTKQTLKDIWRMVWQENSKTIIMLTNPTETGKKKCDHYWPEDKDQSYHGINVELQSSSDLPDFTTRTFKLTKGDESRNVKQFHYTTWPDHGVPKFSSSLLLLRQKVRAHDRLDKGPPVIHCSAGVGRTGSYIAIDVELERAKTEGVTDVHNFVQLMRTQRTNMVQTLDQYVFVYDCLLEALISGDTLMTVEEYPEILSEMCQYDNMIQKTKLEEQFDILRLITSTIERDDTTTALRTENIAKNRCKNIIPANRCRPYLMTPVEGYNDYINAVFTNSYTKRDGFIITQMPLPNTVTDFWRLVHDHNVSCIVMLNEVDDTDETCEQYWTLETCGEKYGPFIVETTAEIKSDPSITVRDFTVSNTEMPHEIPRVIRQFHFHRWAEGSVIPSSKLALFDLLEMVHSCQEQSGNKPTIVHCMNGASRCGLFVAIGCLIERLKLEKEIDVFQTVKQLRLSRTHLVDNLVEEKKIYIRGQGHMTKMGDLSIYGKLLQKGSTSELAGRLKAGTIQILP